MARLRKLKLLPALYILFLLGFVLRGLLLFAYDRSCEAIALPLASATPEELERVETGAYQSLGGDPRLVFEGVDARLRRVVLPGSFNQPPGEMDLYYTKKEGQGFSAKKRVWARPVDDGYEYLLPPGRYHSLRLDVGTSEQNLLAASELLLNPPAPLWRYWLPSLREALSLLILPALASCVIYFIIEVLNNYRQKPENASEKGTQTDAT